MRRWVVIVLLETTASTINIKEASRGFHVDRL
jgi:hypothetical protein